jgi:hypothetical protein
MENSAWYVLIAIIILALVAALVFLLPGKTTKNRKLTPLAGLAFGFILAGIFFSDESGERMFGFGMIGIGVILAVIDIVRKQRRNS